jgi:glycosyltransferase involved in cell wall biosynthesis
MMIFMGRGSEQFAESLRAAYPELGDRIRGTGGLASEALAQHLSACDILVQPFEDGVSTRRGSVTAALALGIPVATTRGITTEELWETSGAVGLAPAETAPDSLIELVDQLANDPRKRAEMGVRSRRLYAERFAVEHTVVALQREANARLDVHRTCVAPL